MNSEYRQLTESEILTLEDQGCYAQDWNNVKVAEDFLPHYVKNVSFYGYNNLGVFEKDLEVTKGFFKHSGIFNATLKDTTIGDNSLIEKIGNYINDYEIGSETIISNTSTIETTEGASFGEGNIISVLNEVGDGNIMLFSKLTSQIAALFTKYSDKQEFISALRKLVKLEVDNDRLPCGRIGNGVKIVNTTEIINTHIDDDCEIVGACRLSDCSIKSNKHATVYIGSGVICESSIICSSSSILNSAKISNCFVGEACCITNGFTAESSVFFANCHMANGEACAAFCGPFTSSHHKSSLLIGGMFSFYNAGSATNFSNHAYKMGPIHYGTLERGCKTASGAYLLMPAKIGTFSVCFGKLMYHPDTRSLPFSYLIAYGDIMYLVPGRNITTVGLYRDIRKWPKRDMRPHGSHKSIVNFDWLSPFSVAELLQGKQILERLREASGSSVSSYNYHEYVIKEPSLKKGIKYYDIALRIFMGAVLKRHSVVYPTTNAGKEHWNDLAGLLLPASEERRLVNEVINGNIASIDELLDSLTAIHNNYGEYRWTYTYHLICKYYGVDEINSDIEEQVKQDYITARRAWIAEIRKDAQREYEMGDVEDCVLTSFLEQLDHEIDFENIKIEDI